MKKFIIQTWFIIFLFVPLFSIIVLDEFNNKRIVTPFVHKFTVDGEERNEYNYISNALKFSISQPKKLDFGVFFNRSKKFENYDYDTSYYDGHTKKYQHLSYQIIRQEDLPINLLEEYQQKYIKSHISRPLYWYIVLLVIFVALYIFQLFKNRNNINYITQIFNKDKLKASILSIISTVILPLPIIFAPRNLGLAAVGYVVFFVWPIWFFALIILPIIYLVKRKNKTTTLTFIKIFILTIISAALVIGLESLSRIIG